jgi:phage terminase large subunit-like protein
VVVQKDHPLNELSVKAKKLLKKDPRLLLPEEKAFVRAELMAQKQAYLDFIEQAKTSNPFWYYAPVTGEIQGERRAFLRNYLKEEDIPQKLHGAIDVHLSGASIRGASGGNQSSKTTTGCIEALIKATGALPHCFDPAHGGKFTYPAHRLVRKGPQHVRVVGEDFQNGILRNLIPTYRKWAPREYLIDGSWEKSYSSGEQILRLTDPMTKQLTGTVEFMSNKQDLGTFQGPPRHMLVFDEEPNHDVYKENLMRFTTASSLDVLFCMTPTKGLSWTYDLFTRGTDEEGNNVDWFQIASVCNPFANLKVLREILNEMESYEELKMRILGEFVSLSGLVYGKLFQHSVHVIPPFDTACNCGGLRSSHIDSCPYSLYMGFVGLDPHMVKDSCAALCFVDREDNFFVDTCYKRSVTVEELKRDITDLCQGRRVVKKVADPSSDSSLTIHDNVNVFELLRRGKFALNNLTKADKFPGSIAAGISNIKERLRIGERTKKPRFFIFDRPENKLLIKTFKTLQRETWSNEEEKGQKDKIAEGIHDHHACVRYLLQRRFSWRPLSSDTPGVFIPDEEAILV